ncbi:hypothetical protein AVEN_194570-1 [Araneus ventricosus]|uniref:Uncharacterized protein n=1 Tax=Araneus ventricosus TaxID=182803 RepID=A0A4Y2A6L2_ARAVE|nr:hypothetical protein AVEN_194570-1 [Araneus ventricosus]
MLAILTAEPFGDKLVLASPVWENFLCVWSGIGLVEKKQVGWVSAGSGWLHIFGSRPCRRTDDPKEEVFVVISKIHQRITSEFVDGRVFSDENLSRKP